MRGPVGGSGKPIGGLQTPGGLAQAPKVNPNVTLGPPQAAEAPPPRVTIPCFLCGDPAELRASKRKKPYFICDPCGLQAFIRKQRGIDLLARKTTPYLETENGVLKTLGQLERVSEKLEELRGDKPWFSDNPELELAVKALEMEKRRLQRLLKLGDKPRIPGKARKPGNPK